MLNLFQFRSLPRASINLYSVREFWLLPFSPTTPHHRLSLVIGQQPYAITVIKGNWVIN